MHNFHKHQKITGLINKENVVDKFRYIIIRNRKCNKNLLITNKIINHREAILDSACSAILICCLSAVLRAAFPSTGCIASCTLRCPSSPSSRTTAKLHLYQLEENRSVRDWKWSHSERNHKPFSRFEGVGTTFDPVAYSFHQTKRTAQNPKRPSQKKHKKYTAL